MQVLFNIDITIYNLQASLQVLLIALANVNFGWKDDKDCKNLLFFHYICNQIKTNFLNEKEILFYINDSKIERRKFLLTKLSHWLD